MNTKIFFILLWCAYLPARPIIVAQDGSGDYSTIQQAIDHFTPRDHTYQTIFIKKGIYKEKISIDSTMHHLKIKGERAAKVTIVYTQARDIWRCENPDDYGAATFNIKGHDLIFEQLTIINDYGFNATEDIIIDCAGEAGRSNLSTIQNFNLPREDGDQVGKKIVRKDGHQFAVRSMPGATRLKFFYCTFRSGGGDTMSPWDVDGGMYYFDHCVIEGGVDLYCPRGNAIIKNSLFICHNKSAAIWHDGSSKASDRSVLIHCRFTGDPGFKLGRYHREAQMYLISCSFDGNMADAEIYQAGDRKLEWGTRIYYRDCHRDGGDWGWFGDNTKLIKRDFTVQKVFGSKW